MPGILNQPQKPQGILSLPPEVLQALIQRIKAQKMVGGQLQMPQNQNGFPTAPPVNPFGMQNINGALPQGTQLPQNNPLQNILRMLMQGGGPYQSSAPRG